MASFASTQSSSTPIGAAVLVTLLGVGTLAWLVFRRWRSADGDEREAERGTVTVGLAALAVLLLVLGLVADVFDPRLRIGLPALALVAALVAAAAEWTRRWLRVLAVLGLLLLVLALADIGRAAVTGSTDDAVEEVEKLQSDVDVLEPRARTVTAEAEVAAGAERAATREALTSAIGDAGQSGLSAAAATVHDALLGRGDVGLDRARVRFAQRYVAADASPTDEQLLTAVDEAVAAARQEVAAPDSSDATTALADACATASDDGELSDACDRDGGTPREDLEVSLATARLRVAEYRQAVLGRDEDEAAVTEARAALGKALVSATGPAAPDSDFLESVASGADELSDQVRLGLVPWIVVAAAALLGWRLLEARSARQLPGPVLMEFRTGESPSSSDADPVPGRTSIFRIALLKNIREPAAAPGATHPSPVTDLAELSTTLGPAWLKALVAAVHKLLSTEHGYRAEVELVSPAKSGGTATKPLWRVLVSLSDVASGQQVAVHEVTDEDQDAACRAAGYWAAGVILARSTRVPAWSKWSGDTADALAAADSANGEDLTTLEKAVALAPSCGLLVVKLAQEYDLTGRHEEALALYARAVAMHPRYLVARYRLATSLGLMAGGAKGDWLPLPPSARRRIAGEVIRARQVLWQSQTVATPDLVFEQDLSAIGRSFQLLARQHYNDLCTATRRPLDLTGIRRRSERDLWLPLIGRSEARRGFVDRLHWTARSAALVNQVVLDPARVPDEAALGEVEAEARTTSSSWQVSYNLGCLHARRGAGAASEALDWLETALSRPGAEQMTGRWLSKDPDLASLRDHPRFLALCRCLTNAEDDHA